MSKRFLVYSIFQSVDGEFNGYDGAGQLTTFIRLQGCNLRCTYCDTKYAQEMDAPPEFPGLGFRHLEDIIRSVRAWSGKKVTVTGGEPLIQPNITDLLAALIYDGYDVTLETNGSITLRSIWSFFPRVRDDEGQTGSLRIVMDYKLPSSGMDDRMDVDNLNVLRPQDVVKFVVGTEEDYEEMRSIIGVPGSYLHCPSRSSIRARIAISPAINLRDPNPMQWPRELADRIISDRGLRGFDVHYSLQLHKVLWPEADATDER